MLKQTNKPSFNFQKCSSFKTRRSKLTSPPALARAAELPCTCLFRQAPRSLTPLEILGCSWKRQGQPLTNSWNFPEMLGVLQKLSDKSGATLDFTSISTPETIKQCKGTKCPPKRNSPSNPSLHHIFRCFPFCSMLFRVCVYCPMFPEVFCVFRCLLLSFQVFGSICLCCVSRCVPLVRPMVPFLFQLSMFPGVSGVPDVFCVSHCVLSFAGNSTMLRDVYAFLGTCTGTSAKSNTQFLWSVSPRRNPRWVPDGLEKCPGEKRQCAPSLGARTLGLRHIPIESVSVGSQDD